MIKLTFPNYEFFHNIDKNHESFIKKLMAGNDNLAPSKTIALRAHRKIELMLKSRVKINYSKNFTKILPEC